MGCKTLKWDIAIFFSILPLGLILTLSISRKVYHPIKFLKRFQLSKMEKYSLGRIFYKNWLGIDLFTSTLFMISFLVLSSKENNLKKSSSLLNSKHPPMMPSSLLCSKRIHAGRVGPKSYVFGWLSII